MTVATNGSTVCVQVSELVMLKAMNLFALVVMKFSFLLSDCEKLVFIMYDFYCVVRIIMHETAIQQIEQLLCTCTASLGA